MLMIQKGFKFGMILQLAIGPMCLFVFQTSLAHNFFYGELAVIGTAIVDSLEIILAIIGIGALLERSERAKWFLKIFGIVILILYGCVSILGAFDISLLPSLDLTSIHSSHIVIQAILLALSDPLTIVFWAGIFSAKISEEHFSQNDLQHFAFGCVLATLSFLSLISLAGSLIEYMIPTLIIKILNIMVGLLMFYFAYKNIISKTTLSQI